MKSKPKFARGVIIASVVIIAGGFYPLYIVAHGELIVYVSAAIGFSISLANVIVGYRIIANSVGKPARLFATMVLGSMVIRMFGILILLWILIGVISLPPESLAASLLISYFVFMIVEIQTLIHRAGIMPQA